MKKIITALVSIVLLLSACKKTTETSNPGPIAYAQDLQLFTNAWQENGTSGTPGADVTVYIIDTLMTSSIYNNGTVLVYILNSDGVNYDAMPFTSFSTDGTVSFNHTYYYDQSGIGLKIVASNWTFDVPVNTTNFKIVFIPGSSKTSWPVDLSNYNAVKAFFNIKTVH